MTPEQLHQMHLKNLTDYGGLQPFQLMGLCIYMEAAGEPHEGRVAVGTIILNRADAHHCGKDIIDVICWPWQFSWTLESDREHASSIQIAQDFDTSYQKAPALQQCTDLAKSMIEGDTPRDPDLAGCFDYLNPHTAPEQFKDRLARGDRVIKTINKHVFLAQGGKNV